MKKKLFLAIIAVLVVCLMCGVLFVACNDDPPADDGGSGGVTPPPVDPDNPDPGDEEDELTKSGVFIDLVKNFDAVEQDTTGEKEFTFGLQIKDRADQTSIFSIALENVGGKDYLYGAVGTTVFTKFNGFDLGETFMTILNWLGPIDLSEVVGIQAGLDVKSLTNPLVAGIASDMLIGDFAVSESGDAYMVELSISKVLATIGTFVDLDAVINGALGEDTVTTVVNAVAGVIGIELAEGSATVTGLLNAIANAYQVNFYFGFDTATADSEDPFDGLLPGVQDARGTQAKNLLNFEGEVIVEGLDAESNIDNTYVLDIDVDVNPFVALGLLDYVSTTGGVMTGNLVFSFGGFGPSDIVAMLEDAGYIHISLDKYAGTNTDADPVRNLFTLHYDSAEGKAVVSVATNEVTVGEQDLALAAGGVYDIDALAQVVDMLIKNAANKDAGFVLPAETAADGNHEHTDANGDGICDDETCKQIANVMAYVMGKLPALGNCFTIENGTFDVNEEALAVVAQQVLNDTAYLTNLTSEEIGGFVTAFKEFVDTIGYNTTDGLKLDGDKLADLVEKVLTTLKSKGVITDENLTDDELAAFVAAAAKVEGLINFTTTGGLQIGVDNALDIAETFLKFFFPDKVDAIGQAKAYVSDLLGGHAQLRFKVAEGAFSFGHFEENEKIAFENLTYNLSDDGAYVETITAISKADGTAIAVGDTVNVTGKGFDGTEITAEGVVMAIGNDGTYYVGIYTDLNTNLGVLEGIINSFAEPDIAINIQPSWPFYGVLAYTPAA